MQRMAVAVLLGSVIGFLAAGGNTLTTFVQAATFAQERAGRGARPIPPVPNPPLYPDPPQKPMYWSAEELGKIYQVRLAYAKAHANENPRFGPAPGSMFDGQSFRTHSVIMQFRWKYPAPRPTRYLGVMNQDDDADQHGRGTDFCVFIGGRGQTVLGGEIETRVINGSADKPESNRRVKPGENVPLTSEFNGLPVKNGRTYDVKSGDWTMIPVNLVHAYISAPDQGLMYLVTKIGIE